MSIVWSLTRPSLSLGDPLNPTRYASKLGQLVLLLLFERSGRVLRSLSELPQIPHASAQPNRNKLRYGSRRIAQQRGSSMDQSLIGVITRRMETGQFGSDVGMIGGHHMRAKDGETRYRWQARLSQH